MDYLNNLRNRIDKIDNELLRLFEERMEAVTEVAKFKEENNIPILNSEREKEVIRKNISMLKNKDFENEVKEFFEYLMYISRKFQSKRIFSRDSNFQNIDIQNKKSSKPYKCTVGFQGVKGSFSEQALFEYFKDGVETLSVPEFEDVFKELKNNRIDYGVLPIENSSTGGITEVYDLLRKYGFFIVGEKCIDIQHNWTLIPYHNTALSAQFIKSLNDRSKAAVASKRTADIYGLNVIDENINCSQNNRTRFIIIGKDMEIDENCDKVSVVFALEHRAGSLYNALKYFAENNLNMLKIESRPIIDKSWQYFFYIDFEGNLQDIRVKNTLKLIEKNSFYFKLLGNYKNSI